MQPPAPSALLPGRPPAETSYDEGDEALRLRAVADIGRERTGQQGLLGQHLPYNNKGKWDNAQHKPGSKHHLQARDQEQVPGVDGMANVAIDPAIHDRLRRPDVEVLEIEPVTPELHPGGDGEAEPQEIKGTTDESKVRRSARDGQDVEKQGLDEQEGQHEDLYDLHDSRPERHGGALRRPIGALENLPDRLVQDEPEEQGNADEVRQMRADHSFTPAGTLG